MTTIILTESERRRAMRQTILCQCFGVLGQTLFTSNVVLLYLLALGIGEAQTLMYLALPNIISAALTVPAAHLSDRVGIKRTGGVGVLVVTIGILILGAAGIFVVPAAKAICCAAGLIVFGAGMAAFNAIILSLLQPIIPESVRGRFFGLNRMSWQLVSLGMSALIAFLLSLWHDLAIFQVIILVTAGLTLFRSVFYRAIPELTTPSKEQTALLTALVRLGGTREYVAFGSYIFLLTMFTAVCPSLFALVERVALNLSQSAIVMLANVGMIGAIIGFWLGGIAVDRYGTKHVFLVCHFSYGFILSLFVLRGLFPASALVALLGMLHFLFGMIMSSSSIAITSESMALSPARHHTLALALLGSVQSAGIFLSGFLSSGALKAGFLMKHWSWKGVTLCDVDAVIAGCAVMVVILVVTLGLVPSIFRKTDLGTAG
ncbi:MAG: MFS transporter [Kiritimatiellia bacterium]|nr:MFS transporter [Kiritimatiellia bacterium]